MHEADDFAEPDNGPDVPVVIVLIVVNARREMPGILAVLVVALVAAMLGFNGIGSGAADVANVLVIGILIVAGVNFFLGRRWR
jgi:uncharacterized membrane protein YtjA (UPF0391 family)